MVVEWESRRTFSHISLSDVIVGRDGFLPAKFVGWVDDFVNAREIPGLRQWWIAVSTGSPRPARDDEIDLLSESSSSESESIESSPRPAHDDEIDLLSESSSSESESIESESSDEMSESTA